MRTKGREQGRFVALAGFRKLAGVPGGRYEVLIVDGQGRPVSPLCAWYRLRKQPGANGIRRTYLNFLQPFLAYLLSHGHAWSVASEQIQERMNIDFDWVTVHTPTLSVEYVKRGFFVNHAANETRDTVSFLCSRG